MRVIPDEAWAVLTIWQESRGESHAGRVAVAEVIRNRTLRHYASDGTVASTCLRPLQFSGWNTKDPNRVPSAKLDDTDPMVADCLAAWREAQAGSNLAKGAVLYYSPLGVAAPPAWAVNCVQVATIGHHLFFIPKGFTP